MCEACTNNYSNINNIIPFIKTDSIHPIHDWQDIYWKTETEQYDDYGNFEFQIKKMSPRSKVIKGPDVLFKLNNYGFRSSKFDKLSSSKKNILFTGCSNTFGAALPEELRWSSIFSKKMDVNEYNVATYGAGIDLSIKNAMGFINLFGKPDAVIMLLPDMARQTVYSDFAKTYIKASPLWSHLEDKNVDPALKDFTIGYKHQNLWFYNTTLINMFEEFCNASGIKLIWSTWSSADLNVYNRLKFKNLLNKNLNMVRWQEPKAGTYAQSYENKKHYPYWEMAADDAHPGSQWHQYVADTFLEAYNND